MVNCNCRPGPGDRESHEALRDFIRDMQARGLRHPPMCTTDGAPGLIRAVEECFPRSRRQRCLAHKLRNVTQKVPNAHRDEVRAAVRSAYYAPNRGIAETVAKSVVREYEGRFPSAMASFQDDLEACWSYLEFPVIHHKRIRTTGADPVQWTLLGRRTSRWMSAGPENALDPPGRGEGDDGTHVVVGEFRELRHDFSPTPVAEQTGGRLVPPRGPCTTTPLPASAIFESQPRPAP